MRIKALFPFLIFCVISLALYIGLNLNPSNIPSALINDPIPEFSLPIVGGEAPGFSSADLAAEDGVILVNFFASWWALLY